MVGLYLYINGIVCSGISESETTNNKRLRSTFCIEAIQTRSIARPLCDSRASCVARIYKWKYAHVACAASGDDFRYILRFYRNTHTVNAVTITVG